MAIESPETLTATCDACGEQEDMEVTEYCGEPASWGVDDSTLENEGWIWKDGELLCPKCCGEEE